jgi:GR25 family glycosyltransferase involved in LPS biosynthesis
MSHNIEHIFYINLDHRTDRKEQIENELELMNLKHNSERFEAIKCKPGIAGCGYSHLAVLKLAKERGYKNVLIFEDDFTFLINKEELEFELDRFFKEVKEFDVCMLAYNLKRSEPTEFPFVVKALEVQTASAYIVHNRFYDKLIELYEDVIPKLEKTDMHWLYANDQAWKVLQPTNAWYCFSHRLGKQRPSFSDNTLRFDDYNV